MEEGEIEVDSIKEIELDEITPALARRSGFKDVADLLETAHHGKGDNVYLIRFHYVPPATSFLSPRWLARKRAQGR